MIDYQKTDLQYIFAIKNLGQGRRYQKIFKILWQAQGIKSFGGANN